MTYNINFVTYIFKERRLFISKIGKSADDVKTNW